MLNNWHISTAYFWAIK